MDLWTRLEQARARWNVLEHPFYERWSRGELRRDELAAYAGQYRYAVVALADAAAGAAGAAGPDLRPQLEAHAAEEAAHVALWDDFTIAVGGDPAAAANPETAACARVFTLRRAWLNRAALFSYMAFITWESKSPG